MTIAIWQDEVSPADRPQVELALAAALEKNERSHDARQVLISMGAQTGDAEAERLYLLSETARSTSDEEAVQRTLNELRQFGPSSPWLEQALLSAGNMYMLKRDYDHAIDYFRELQQRFPQSKRASYAHWKAAWLSFRQGRTDEARKGFENQIALYPDSTEIPAALYWRARMAEEDGNPAMARAFYTKLSDRFRNYYYAELGRRRLKSLPAAGKSDAEPELQPTLRRTTRCSTTCLRFPARAKLPPPILPTITCASPGRVCFRMAGLLIWPCANCRLLPIRKAEHGRRPRWPGCIKTADAMIAASRS